MKVWLCTGDMYGIGFWRAGIVKRYLDKLGVPAIEIGGVDQKEILNFDVLYIVRPIKQIIPLELVHWAKRQGIPVVMDMDDYLDAVPVWSPAKPYFDPWSERQYLKNLMNSVDLITTTNEYTKSVFNKLTPVPVKVIPNAFDPDYKLLRPMIGGLTGKPTIGWAGGAQHSQDLNAIESTWNECLDRGYTLKFLGDCPPCINGKPNTLMVNGSHNVQHYFQIMPLMGWDVAVAPLLYNDFNRCKSPLKATEYAWLCGCPMVLQDIEAYNEYEADNKWVFKVKGHDKNDWMTAINLATETIRTHGRRYQLNSRYNMNNTIYQWLDAFAEAYKIVKQEEIDVPRQSGEGAGTIMMAPLNSPHRVTVSA